MIRIKNLVENSLFQKFIMGLILLNAITLGLETSPFIEMTYHTYFVGFDIFVISVFTVEVLLRMLVYKGSFFKDGWSLFDLFIVSISLLPTQGGFEILRVLRVLRLLRLLSIVPQMRKIIVALGSVIPGMLSIAGLLMLLFYISAIMTTQLYGKTFPQFFGTLSESFYTLFQIMTLESWSMGVVRPVMEVHPYAWLFFIPFIFVVTFIMVNLIIAIVVDAMSELTKEKNTLVIDEIQQVDNTLHEEIKQLRQEIGELKEMMRR